MSMNWVRIGKEKVFITPSSNSLPLDNTTPFTPDGDYEPATKKYVDDNAGGAPEGTAVKSTGETGGTKFLRENGDGTCSWQAQSAGGLTQPQVMARSFCKC